MYILDMENFDKMRLRKGKSLRELGIDPNILVRARKGKPLRATTMFKLADALGCNPEDLLKKGGE